MHVNGNDSGDESGYSRLYLNNFRSAQLVLIHLYIPEGRDRFLYNRFSRRKMLCNHALVGLVIQPRTGLHNHYKKQADVFGIVWEWLNGFSLQTACRYQNL